MMTLTNLNEKINILANQALANVGNAVGSNTALTQANIAAAFTAAGTNVTALSGAATTHDRTIADPGAALNPAQP
jgi:hypothetical protein